MNFREPISVIPPVTTTDGYFGGVFVDRQAAWTVGGEAGKVNTSLFARTTAGKGLKCFEWNATFILDNYSDAGENVANYAQANKFSSGPTWARCAETCSTEPLPGAQITDEVDVWVSGADTGDKGCVDLTVGDGKFLRKGVQSDCAEAHFAQRTVATQNTPWARFIFGYIVQAFKECGILLDSIATRAIWLRGKYVVGIDLSTAECQSALRLAPGQRMTFEPTDQISWSWLDGKLRVTNGNVHVLQIDTSTGDVYKMGKKVL